MAALGSDWLRHFRLLWNCITEFNETWQEARYPCLLPSLCFLDRSENQDGRPASDWLGHFLLLWNSRTEFNEIWQKVRSKRPLPSLFSVRTENQDGHPASDWLTHFDFFSETAWVVFKATWQEARSQYSLRHLCFSGRSVSKTGRLDRSVKKVAHCTQLHDMWPFSKYSRQTFHFNVM